MVEPIPTWEYRIEREIPLETLDVLGRQGWELIESSENRYVFKRPALSFVERVTIEQRARYYESLGLDPNEAR